jgi:CDP-glucose 4,6-dehydratase
MSENFWHGRRVLITGVNGFLGAWLAQALVERQAQVFGLDRCPHGALALHEGLPDHVELMTAEVTSLQDLRRVLARSKPQTCFHLAGQSMVEAADGSPIPTCEANVVGTWVVLEAARHSTSLEGIVVASSNHVYGEQAVQPSVEDLPLNGSSPYAASKACADIIARCFAQSYGMPVAMARTTNTYGGADPHQTHLVTAAILSLLNGQPPVIHGDGSPVKSYLYVRDTISGYLLLGEQAARPEVRGKPFNFCTDTPIDVLGLVNTMMQVAGVTGMAPRILGQSGVGRCHEWLSNDRARAVLGWRPRYSLEAGLRETIAWYRAHGERFANDPGGHVRVSA